MLFRRTDQRSNPDNAVSTPMTREDIGDYLGLTTETVSRTFTLLKQEGLIAQEPEGKIRLLNVEALSKIAEGF
jgi:CRP/FNR family transcriptional regulator